MKTESKKKCNDIPRESQPFFRFRLFVAGEEPNSRNAKKELSEFCSEFLNDRAEIRIIDVLEDYHAAIDNKVVVIPTLIVDSPAPGAIIIGSLTNREKLLAALGLTEKNEKDE